MICSMHFFIERPAPEFLSMILFGVKIVIPTILLYAILLFYFGKGFREIMTRIPIVRKMVAAFKST